MRFADLDEVGPWTARKLELLEKYLSAYTRILTTRNWCTGVHYIDAFAGASVHVDRETRELLDGSPRIALKVEPPFNRLIFIEKNEERVKCLNALRDEYPDRRIEVRPGDCNDILPQIFAQIPGDQRAFLLLDPYNLGVRWETIEAASEAGEQRGSRFYKTIEIMINFCLHDANRNVVRSRPEDMDPHQTERLTQVWGGENWKQAVYAPDLTLFGPEDVKVKDVPNRLSAGFRARLEQVYEHVSDYVIMRNARNAPQYSLILASHVGVAQKIMNDIIEYAER
jgi:three-Cys-motif partner protein